MLQLSTHPIRVWNPFPGQNYSDFFFVREMSLQVKKEKKYLIRFSLMFLYIVQYIYRVYMYRMWNLRNGNLFVVELYVQWAQSCLLAECERNTSLQFGRILLECSQIFLKMMKKGLVSSKFPLRHFKIIGTCSFYFNEKKLNYETLDFTKSNGEIKFFLV